MFTALLAGLVMLTTIAQPTIGNVHFEGNDVVIEIQHDEKYLGFTFLLETEFAPEEVIGADTIEFIDGHFEIHTDFPPPVKQFHEVRLVYEELPFPATWEVTGGVLIDKIDGCIRFIPAVIVDGNTGLDEIGLASELKTFGKLKSSY